MNNRTQQFSSNNNQSMEEKKDLICQKLSYKTNTYIDFI